MNKRWFALCFFNIYFDILKNYSFNITLCILINKSVYHRTLPARFTKLNSELNAAFEMLVGPGKIEIITQSKWCNVEFETAFVRTVVYFCNWLLYLCLVRGYFPFLLPARPGKACIGFWTCHARMSMPGNWKLNSLRFMRITWISLSYLDNVRLHDVQSILCDALLCHFSFVQFPWEYALIYPIANIARLALARVQVAYGTWMAQL